MTGKTVEERAFGCLYSQNQHYSAPER